MSEIDAIHEALRGAANRRRRQRALNGMSRGLFFGSCVWLLALGIFKVAPIPYLIVTGAALFAGLLTVALGLRGWLQKPTMAETARWVDSKQHLQERLSTALEMAGAGGDESWRALLLADAARFAQGIDPRKLMPIGLPRISRWAIVALALCAGLGFAPEFRSSVFREKQE